MGWFDVVAGVCTGGLYTVGKAIYQAGNAAEDAGDAAEQAGLAIAVIGTTIQSLGEELKSFLKETEELITIRRLSPRDEDELWDEEKERLNDLKAEKKRVGDELKSLGVDDPDNFSFDFWEMFYDMENVLKKFQLIARIAAVNAEITEILYQEPGVLTTGIYNAKEVLERLNTIEQPLIEDILKSVDDNFEVTEELLKEVKKLFVTRERVPISTAELGPEKIQNIKALELDRRYYLNVLQRKKEVVSGIHDVMNDMPAKNFEFTGSMIHMNRKMNSDYVVDDSILDDNILDNIEVIDDIKIDEDIKIDADIEKIGDIEIAGNSDKFSGPSGETRRRNMNIAGATLKDKNLPDKNIPAPDIGPIGPNGPADSSKSSKTGRSNSNAHSFASENMKFQMDKEQKFTGANMQPHGARISASLATKFDGYQRNYDLLKAQASYYDHQLLKLERKKMRFTHEIVDKPGLIPQTLDEINGVLENVRTDQQPRIDKVLDNLNSNLETLNTKVLETLNDNLEESKSTLAKANDTMETVQNTLSILDFDTKYIKYGAVAIGGLVVLNLFVGLIVLTRAALGI